MIIITDTTNAKALVDTTLSKQLDVRMTNVHDRIEFALCCDTDNTDGKYSARAETGEHMVFEMVDGQIVGHLDEKRYIRPLSSFTFDLGQVK